MKWSMFWRAAISLWLETTQSYGNDSDLARDGAAIFAGDNFNGDFPVPMAVTGDKLAFDTVNFDHTLHSDDDINSGNFTHLVVTRDSATGAKKIYVNGALSASGTGSTAPGIDSTEVYLGYSFFSGQGIVGVVDDLQVYTGVLADSDIGFLFANPGEVIQTSSLADAVDATDFVWTTGGDANWFGQTTITHDDVDAAKSGAIGDDEESWIETTVTGPGTVSFWWKVSSDDLDGYDFLQLDIDENYETEISGDSGDWEFLTFEVGGGEHTFRWTYFKDNEFSAGEDAGFLDEFTFTPGDALEITTHPFNQTNSPGYRVALFAEATGTPAPTWQWHKVGVGAIPGATNALYIPANSGTAAVAGDYFAIATIDSDSEQTDIATVTFVNAPLPPDWTRAFKAPSDNNNLPIQEVYLACELDSSGNLYSAGSFSGTNTLGAQTFVSANDKFETFIVKQSATGSLIWALAISSTNGQGNSFPQAMAPAPGDGIYVYGVFSGTNQLGTNALVSAQGSSVYLTRLDASGNVLWVRTAGGTNSNFTSFHQMVAEPSGNVTISALMNGPVSFGTTNITLDGQKGVLAQYDANGNLRWLQQPSGWFMYLTYDSGRLYGSMGGSETNYVGGLTNLSDRKWVLAALNPDNGQAFWLRNIASERNQGNPLGIGDDVPTIAVSGTNIFLIGSGWGSNAVFGAFSVSWPVSKGQYFARYDTNGTAQLAKGFGSATTSPFASVADASGNVYVGGDFDTYSIFGNNLITAQPQEIVQPGFFSHGFVAKFDRNGSPLWARWAESQTALVSVRDLALAPDGIWACGLIKSPTTFGTHTVFSADTCTGTFCSPLYHRSGVLAKITDGVAAALPTTILNPTRVGNNFTFQFLSQSGFSHFVESRTNIANGTWIQRTNLAGDGSTKTIQLPATNLSTDFFRIRTQ